MPTQQPGIRTRRACRWPWGWRTPWPSSFSSAAARSCSTAGRGPLLRPGGRIAVADLDTEPGSFHADNTGVHHFGFDRTKLAELAVGAGFDGVTIHTAYRMKKTTADESTREFPIFLLTAVRG